MIKLIEEVLQAEVLGDTEYLQEDVKRALVAAALRAARIEGPGVFDVHHVHFGANAVTSVEVTKVKI
jgi:hypothetical protein